jgi:hypothetical protein
VDENTREARERAAHGGTGIGASILGRIHPTPEGRAEECWQARLSDGERDVDLRVWALPSLFSTTDPSPALIEAIERRAAEQGLDALRQAGELSLLDEPV